MRSSVIWSTSDQRLVNVNMFISLVILLSELVSGSYLGGRTGEELPILDLTARPYSQLTGLTGLRELQRPWTLYSCLIQDETEDASWSALSPVILKNSLNFTVYFCIFLYISIIDCPPVCFYDRAEKYIACTLDPERCTVVSKNVVNVLLDSDVVKKDSTKLMFTCLSLSIL